MILHVAEVVGDIAAFADETQVRLDYVLYRVVLHCFNYIIYTSLIHKFVIYYFRSHLLRRFSMVNAEMRLEIAQSSIHFFLQFCCYGKRRGGKVKRLSDVT